MVSKIVTFGFPLYLLLFEWLARSAFQIKTSVFIGPTLASIGLGFVLPLTAVEVKEVTIIDPKTGENMETKISDPKDVEASNASWIVLLILMLFWLIAIYQSVTNPTKVLFWGITTAMLLGGINFVAGVFLSLWRKK